MKITSKICTALALAAGTAFAGTASADVVDTFKKTCMGGLDNPRKIERLARRNGFKKSELGKVLGGYMGDNMAVDQTVQVNIASKNAFECAVTTSDVSNPKALRARFFEAVGLPDSNKDVAAKIGGKTYVFRFDTKGGEALVVYRK